MSKIDNVIATMGLDTQGELAEALGVTQAHISKCHLTDRIPVKLALRIESKTGIPRHELAPELFEGYQRIAPLPVPAEEEKK